IDQSFIRELSSNPDAAAIVRAVVALGRSLNISTTAEGVETAPQFAYLKGEVCDEVQGYYFDKPLPYATLMDRLQMAPPDKASPEYAAT
ncbi:MAG: EAL domain-containing protein, partial [Pseudomonadota bacterium]